MGKTNVIIDANNLSYRMFSTLDLWNSDGENVSAVFGVIKNIHSLVEKFEPDRVIVAWDPVHGTVPWRRKLYPEYKMNRRKDLDEEKAAQLEDFYRQNEVLQLNLSWLPIHQLITEDLEADDIIYLLTKNVLTEDTNIIVSTDKDLLQLLDNNTVVWSPIKEVLITSKGHKRKYEDVKVKTFERFISEALKDAGEITLEQYVDFKVLVGDSSDNVAGVPGIGEKTAVKLLNEYGSIRKMIKNPEPLLAKKTTAKVVQDPKLLVTLEDIMDISKVEEHMNGCLKDLKDAVIQPSADFKRFWNFARSNDFKSIYMN